MKFGTLARAALLLVSAAGLSACGKKLGPYPVEVLPKQNFELKTASGRTLSFEADQKFSAIATYLGRKNLIQLNIGPELVQFQGAKFDKNTAQIYATPEKSGQGIGVVVSRSLVCNPDCETREVRTEEEVCTYYVEYRRTVCYNHPSGVICRDEWTQVPRTGSQWVEYVTTSSTYSVKASLYDLNMKDLAAAEGRYVDTRNSTRAVTPCQ